MVMVMAVTARTEAVANGCGEEGGGGGGDEHVGCGGDGTLRQHTRSELVSMLTNDARRVYMGCAAGASAHRIRRWEVVDDGSEDGGPMGSRIPPTSDIVRGRDTGLGPDVRASRPVYLLPDVIRIRGRPS
mmetsp:Transcript_34336/g.90334  ORF Transcript_34336/g.90334 Transcript_34336/m.90334 type:complete len:130 (+) Transcript_34336:97-486(+)